MAQISQRRQDSSPQGSNRLLRPYPAGYSIPTTDCQMSTRTPRKRWATTENNIGTKSHPSNWRPRRDVETSRYRQFCLLMELSYVCRWNNLSSVPAELGKKKEEREGQRVSAVLCSIEYGYSRLIQSRSVLNRTKQLHLTPFLYLVYC